MAVSFIAEGNSREYAHYVGIIIWPLKVKNWPQDFHVWW
jgi:hypothetical protein